MPKYALDQNFKRVYVDYANKDVDYFCQTCGKRVFPKKGEVRSHHYSHYIGESCLDNWKYDEMSVFRNEWMLQFPEENREIVVDYNGEKHIADILKDNLIIEFQETPLSKKEFVNRNTFFTNAGYKVVWIVSMIREFFKKEMRVMDYNSSIIKYEHKPAMLRGYKHSGSEDVFVYFQEFYNPWSERSDGKSAILHQYDYLNGENHIFISNNTTSDKKLLKDKFGIEIPYPERARNKPIIKKEEAIIKTPIFDAYQTNYLDIQNVSESTPVLIESKEEIIEKPTTYNGETLVSIRELYKGFERIKVKNLKTGKETIFVKEGLNNYIDVTQAKDANEKIWELVEVLE